MQVIGRQPQRAKGPVDPPTSDRITSAFQDWLQRLQTHERNVGVFYFCGHGVHVDDDVLLTADFGRNKALPWADAFNISETITAMRRAVPGPLYFFLDTCRETFWVAQAGSARPLLDAVVVAQAISAGDLTSSVTFAGRDEVTVLQQALAEMNESLVRIVIQVRESSDSIATGSAQIATGNADLSQRTEEQASNLEETAASMEELTATVKTNADKTQAATQLASSASAVAMKGGEVVGRVGSTMQNITGASQKINDIIGVIDGIAFQTNILALNAAVEAARAGEQGRGFAVVASEVRSLAQRSASAAKEIKALISTNVEQVEAGSRLVAEAGETMNDIVSQVRRVSDLIS